MPRSFLIKKARSADRNGIVDAGCPPGLDLRTHIPASLSIKGRWMPRLEEVGVALVGGGGGSMRCGYGILPAPPIMPVPEVSHLHGGDRTVVSIHDHQHHHYPGHHHEHHHHHHHHPHRQESPPPPPPPPPGSERVRTEPAFAALAPYTPTAIEPLAVRLANGYIHDMYAPSRMYPSSLPSAKDHIPSHVIDNDLDLYAKTTPREDDVRSNASSGTTATLHDDQHSIMSMESAKDLRKRSPGSSSSASGAGSPKGAPFQSGVTVAYTYDAFFITDGRSRRRNQLGLAIPDQTRPKYTCNECRKQYATSSNLSRHKQTHRSLESPNAKKCPHCDKVYVSMPALSMHILTHNLKHQCPVCGKAFSRPWLLQGHIRSHSGEKPYGCAHCGKAFADRSNLRAHMQTHSSFKHYECKRCNKSFALKSYLNKHYESACLRDTTSNSSLNSPPSSPEPYIDVQH